MPQFYVTVRKIQTWNLTVEAEDEIDVLGIAYEEIEQVDPDYTDWEDSVDEVTRYVE